MKNRRLGFTLIELLVVIAIIAILAAILFPVFKNAMNTAKSATCASNLKQLGDAMRMYLDDWNRAMPADLSFAATWGKPAKAGLRGWSELFWKYHKKVALYKCPSSKVNFSYSLNGNLEIKGDPVRPSKTIAIFDCPGTGNPAYKINPLNENHFLSGNSNNSNGDADGRAGGQMEGNTSYDPNTSYHDLAYAPANMDDANIPRPKACWLLFPGPHNGNSNILFWDGHVKAFSSWQPGTLTFWPHR